MPTPIELILDPLSLLFIGLYAAMIVWEFCFPARTLEQVPHWHWKGLAAFGVYFLLSSYLPLWWDAGLAQYRLFDLDAWPVWLQFGAGLVAFEFFNYWWHRSLHSSRLLWRGFHQMHHSAERLDSFGAFWLSPLDIAGFTFAGSFALVLVAGVGPQAATALMLATFFFAVFQHMNVNTPRWLGYLVQRPESHSLHHGKGIHRDNYANLPVFDMLFGTFQNPAGHMATGFYSGASSRVLDMLLFRNVWGRTSITE